ncbi:hypothetical protein CB1_000394002 [Camelus ferus]|nr:hypothetical protein CB1_000394002 [Camelus ferus]
MAPQHGHRCHSWGSQRLGTLGKDPEPSAGSRSCKSTEWLQEELEALGSVLLLLLNCQVHELFVQLDGHQPGHHGPHAAPPAQGQPPICSIIPNHADKERIATGYPTARWPPCCSTPRLRLSDSQSPALWPQCLAFSCKSCVRSAARPATSKVVVQQVPGRVLRALRPTWTAHPHRAAHCPPRCWAWGASASALCSDGESDRQLPSSATESDSSPVPSSPLAFPIQILSYLYLGCAKDSISLDVLGEYSIGCIVDVTPNLPNAFEHRQAQPHL